MDGGEVVLFRSPSDDAKLWFFDLAERTTETDLTALASPFGLIFEAVVRWKESSQALVKAAATGVSALYGWVRFYLVADATRACKGLKGKSLHSRPLKPMVNNPEHLRPNAQFGLPLEKCIQLANVLLGFNRWSSQIVELRKYNHVKDKEVLSSLTRAKALPHQYHPSRTSFICTVKLELLEDQLAVFATGVGHCSASESKLAQLENARKRAVSNALMNCWNDLAVIILPCGRPCVVHMAPPTTAAQPN
eukprot:gb/GEZN01013878.1/.p1 GENE.gb/GEZN01013878.1/~~gb/GEZN01013878.1/.p1  ORF type:complete len:270 (+),score=38.40 gb/GEZN01013878.1/:65-811(+)